VRDNIKHDDGSLEAPVTNVDSLMEDSFVSGVRFGCPGNLNKGGRWESVVAMLEGENVSKQERFNRTEQVWETIFQVPIVGHKIFLAPKQDEHELMGGSEVMSREQRRIKQNPSQYLLYLGQYYDTSLFYSYHPDLSNTLKVEAPLTPPMHQGPLLRCVTYRSSSSTRLHHCQLHQHTRQQGQRGWCAATEGDWLEINLGRPRYVTHLGTAGGLPALGMFPTKALVGKKSMRRFREYCGDEKDFQRSRSTGKSKHATYVWVVKDPNYSWVTFYNISYWDLGGKWVPLGEAAGNCDAFTERVYDFKAHFGAQGLLVQHIRITPTAHHRAPTMRIAVYGVDNVGDRDLKSGDGDGAEVAEVPTVEYVISHPSHTTTVRDGLKSKHFPYKDYCRERDRKVFLQRAMRDYSA